jgi:hypothetical protein
VAAEQFSVIAGAFIGFQFALLLGLAGDLGAVISAALGAVVVVLFAWLGIR